VRSCWAICVFSAFICLSDRHRTKIRVPIRRTPIGTATPTPIATSWFDVVLAVEVTVGDAVVAVEDAAAEAGIEEELDEVDIELEVVVVVIAVPINVEAVTGPRLRKLAELVQQPS